MGDMKQYNIKENKEENRVEPLCIGRWGLLLDTKSVMPLLLDTLNKPTL